MPVSKALRRLFEVRGLEEEQRRAALASALGELNGLARALSAARAREHDGRSRIAASAQSAECADRVAGLVEMETSRRTIQMLAPRIAAAEHRAAQLRAEYLTSRMERRQVEAVIRETEVLDAAEEGRREQQNADERFGMRRRWDRAREAIRGAAGQSSRQVYEEREMNEGQESAAFPEEELRFKL